MRIGGSKGPASAPSEEGLLSLQLRLPERLLVPDPQSARSGDGVILHVEVRNRTDRPWESRSAVGPLLEIVLLGDEGEIPLVVRQLPMLAYPAALAPGRGFLLPVRILIPDIPPSGATYRLRVRMDPGAEETCGTLRFEPRV
ncbi:MAG TPA: hypothetical protein PLB02_02220 [Thermoanaerobaculia bacterium]|nr:hypothetical protein [Thermoanaerobaculia bacterium]HQR66186.1 hypothetical protein [Thermoanaerobaculia bacterium]